MMSIGVRMIGQIRLLSRRKGRVVVYLGHFLRSRLYTRCGGCGGGHR